MNPISAVREGVRRIGRAKRMWFVFWFYNLVFSFVLVAPLAALLANSLGHSAYAGQMLPNFDVQWLSEIFVQSRGWPLVLFTPLALVVAGGYLLLSTFLYGGALAVLCDPEGRYRPGVFYRGCGHNFGRLFRLLLLSAVFYAIVLVAGAMLRGAGERIWENGMEQRPVVILNWVRGAVMLLLFLLVNMVFDYAKIRLVAEDSRKAVRAALGSFALVARNFARCAATYAIVAALAVAFYFIYAALSAPLPRERVWGLLLVVLLQQAYVLSRIWSKLLFLSSQREVYAAVTPRRVEPAPEPVYTPAAPEPDPSPQEPEPQS